MSTISKVEGPRGVRWRVRYRTARGASRFKTFGRRADADAWLKSTDYKVIVGEYVDPSAGRVTFATYAERWLDLKRAHNKKPTSIATWRSHLDRHLLPTFGESLLKDIDRAGRDVGARVVGPGRPDDGASGDGDASRRARGSSPPRADRSESGGAGAGRSEDRAARRSSAHRAGCRGGPGDRG